MDQNDTEVYDCFFTQISVESEPSIDSFYGTHPCDDKSFVVAPLRSRPCGGYEYMPSARSHLEQHFTKDFFPVTRRPRSLKDVFSSVSSFEEHSKSLIETTAFEQTRALFRERQRDFLRWPALASPRPLEERNNITISDADPSLEQDRPYHFYGAQYHPINVRDGPHCLISIVGDRIKFNEIISFSDIPISVTMAKLAIEKNPALCNSLIVSSATIEDHFEQHMLNEVNGTYFTDAYYFASIPTNHIWACERYFRDIVGIHINEGYHGLYYAYWSRILNCAGLHRPKNKPSSKRRRKMKRDLLATNFESTANPQFFQAFDGHIYSDPTADLLTVAYINRNLLEMSPIKLTRQERRNGYDLAVVLRRTLNHMFAGAVSTLMENKCGYSPPPLQTVNDEISSVSGRLNGSTLSNIKDSAANISDLTKSAKKFSSETSESIGKATEKTQTFGNSVAGLFGKVKGLLTSFANNVLFSEQMLVLVCLVIVGIIVYTSYKFDLKIMCYACTFLFTTLAIFEFSSCALKLFNLLKELIKSSKFAFRLVDIDSDTVILQDQNGYLYQTNRDRFDATRPGFMEPVPGTFCFCRPRILRDFTPRVVSHRRFASPIDVAFAEEFVFPQHNGGDHSACHPRWIVDGECSTESISDKWDVPNSPRVLVRGDKTVHTSVALPKPIREVSRCHTRLWELDDVIEKEIGPGTQYLEGCFTTHDPRGIMNHAQVTSRNLASDAPHDPTCTYGSINSPNPDFPRPADEEAFGGAEWEIAGAVKSFPVATAISFLVCGGMTAIGGPVSLKSIATMLSIVPKVKFGLTSSSDLLEWAFNRLPEFCKAFAMTRLGLFDKIPLDKKFKTVLVTSFDIVCKWDKEPDVCCADVEACQEMVFQFEKLREIYSQVLMKIDKSHFTHTFVRTLYTKMSGYVGEAKATLQVGHTRAVPVGVVFQGPSQIGKTSMVAAFCAAVFPEAPLERLVYNRMPGMDDWDGYAYHLAVYYDDAFYMNLERVNVGVNPFDDMLTQISNTMMPLNMAKIEHKGMKYNSKLVILSLNKGLIREIPELKDQSAFKNRWPLYFKVSTLPKYWDSKKKKCNMDLVLKDYPTDEERCTFPWLRYALHPFCTERCVSDGHTFLDVVMMTRNAIRVSEERFKSLNAQTRLARAKANSRADPPPAAEVTGTINGTPTCESYIAVVRQMIPDITQEGIDFYRTAFDTYDVGVNTICQAKNLSLGYSWIVNTLLSGVPIQKICPWVTEAHIPAPSRRNMLAMQTLPIQLNGESIWKRMGYDIPPPDPESEADYTIPPAYSAEDSCNKVVVDYDQDFDVYRTTEIPFQPSFDTEGDVAEPVAGLRRVYHYTPAWVSTDTFIDRLYNAASLWNIGVASAFIILSILGGIAGFVATMFGIVKLVKYMIVDKEVTGPEPGSVNATGYDSLVKKSGNGAKAKRATIPARLNGATMDSAIIEKFRKHQYGLRPKHHLVPVGVTTPVFGTDHLVLKHFFDDLEEGGEFDMVLGDKVYSQVYSLNNLVQLNVLEQGGQTPSELCLYRFSVNLPVCPDMRKFFPFHSQLQRKSGNTGLCIDAVSGNTYHDVAQLRSTPIVVTDESKACVVRVHNSFTTDDHYLPGSCGSILFLPGKGSGCEIASGLHVATCTGLKCALFIPVTREIIKQLQDFMNDNPPLEPDVSFEYTAAIDSELTPMTKPSPFPTKGAIVRGILPQDKLPGQGGATSLCKSPLFGKVTGIPSDMEPAILSRKDPRNVMEVQPLYGFMKRTMRNYHAFDALKISAAFNVVVSEMPDCDYEWRIMTIQEAVGGIEGVSHIDSLNMSSSEGYPWVKYRPKDFTSKKWMFECHDGRYTIDETSGLAMRVRDKIEKLKERVIVASTAVDALKDELRPKSKIYDEVKTRVFCMFPVDYVIAYRQYFGFFTKWFIESYATTFSAVGMDVFSTDWDTMINQGTAVSSFGIDVDFSNWDRSLNGEILIWFGDFVNHFYQCFDPNHSPEDDIVRTGLVYEAIHSTELVWNLVLTMCGGMPSGTPFTSIGNTFVNAMMVRLCYMDLSPPGFNLCDFHHLVRDKSFGDDLMLFVSPRVWSWFNPIAISEWFTSVGMKATPANKTDSFTMRPLHFSEMQFLKRKTITNGTLLPGFKYWPQTDEKDLDKMINWRRNTVDMFEAVETNLNNALRMAFFNGKEQFASLRRRIVAACKKCKLNIKLAHYTDLLLTLRDTYGHPALDTIESIESSLAMFSTVVDPAYVHMLVGDLIVPKTIYQSGTINSATPALGQLTEGDADEEAEVQMVNAKTVVPRSMLQRALGSQAFTLSEMAERTQLIETVKWNVGDTTGTIVKMWRAPWDFLKTTITTTPFQRMQWWSGITNVTFQVRAVPMFQGLLKAIFLPWDYEFETAGSQGKLLNTQSILAHAGPFINACGGDSVTIQIPFRHFKAALDLRDHDESDYLGTLVLLVYSPLRVGVGANDYLAVNVKVSFDDNIFAVPALSTADFVPTHAMKKVTLQDRGYPADLRVRGRINGQSISVSKTTVQNYSDVVDSTLGNLKSEDNFEPTSTLDLGIEAETEVEVAAAGGMGGGTGGGGQGGGGKSPLDKLASGLGTVAGAIGGAVNDGRKAAAPKSTHWTGRNATPRGPTSIINPSFDEGGPPVNTRHAGPWNAKKTMDRPAIATEPMANIPRGFPYLGHANNLDYSIPLSLYIEPQTVVEPMHFATSLDEMETELWLGLWQEVGRVEWDNTITAGTKLWDIQMCPCSQLLTATHGETLDLGLLDIYTMRHEFWRGDLMYKVIVVSTAYHSGTLCLCPQYATFVSNDNLILARTQYAKELHLREGNCVYVSTIDFLVNVERLRVPRGNPGNLSLYSLGSLGLYVQNVLQVTSVVHDSVEVIIWMKAGPHYSVETISSNNGACSLTWDNPDVQVGRINSTEIAKGSQGKGLYTTYERKTTHFSHLGHRFTKRASYSILSTMPTSFVFDLTDLLFGNPAPGAEIGVETNCIFDWIHPLFRFYRGDFRIKIYMHSAGKFTSEVWRTPNIVDTDFETEAGVGFLTPHITSELAPFHEISIPFQSNFHIMATPILPAQTPRTGENARIYRQGFLKHSITHITAGMHVDIYVAIGEGFRFGVFMGVPRVRIANGSGSTYGGQAYAMPEHTTLIYSAAGVIYNSTDLRTLASATIASAISARGDINAGAGFFSRMTFETRTLSKALQHAYYKTPYGATNRVYRDGQEATFQSRSKCIGNVIEYNFTYVPGSNTHGHSTTNFPGLITNEWSIDTPVPAGTVEDLPFYDKITVRHTADHLHGNPYSTSGNTTLTVVQSTMLATFQLTNQPINGYGYYISDESYVRFPVTFDTFALAPTRESRDHFGFLKSAFPPPPKR